MKLEDYCAAIFYLIVISRSAWAFTRVAYINIQQVHVLQFRNIWFIMIVLHNKKCFFTINH